MSVSVSVSVVLWVAEYAHTQGMQAQVAGAGAHFLDDIHARYPAPGQRVLTRNVGGVLNGPNRSVLNCIERSVLNMCKDEDQLCWANLLKLHAG